MERKSFLWRRIKRTNLGLYIVRTAIKGFFLFWQNKKGIRKFYIYGFLFGGESGIRTLGPG